MAVMFKSPYPSVDIPSCSFVQHLFTDGKTRFSRSAPAYVDGVTGETCSRGQLESEALALAGAFRNVGQLGLVGLSRGSTVTVFSPNSLVYPKIIHALAAAGICGAYANATYTGFELEHAFKISKSSHFLVDVTLLGTTVASLTSMGFSQEDMKKRVIVLTKKSDIPQQVLADGWAILEDVAAASKPLAEPERFDGAASDDTAAIFFSSGTTGLSKAVALSHRNIVALLAQVGPNWHYYQHGRDSLLAVVPLFHVLGGVILVMFSYFKGIPVVILPRFEPDLFLGTIQKHKISVLVLVPPLLNLLAKHPIVQKYDITSVRFILVGAAPVSPAVFSICIDKWKTWGVDLQICQGYGLTETTGSLSFLNAEDSLTKAGSVGPLLPNIEARLVDEDGNNTGPHGPGELWVRGPNIMKEYANNEKATLDSITPDGWFKTGDVMTLDDDGFMTVVDRKKELIKYKGLQVAPAELESVLFTHPQLTDAGVIGIYSEKDTTELPRAYVVPKDLGILKAPAEQRDKIIQDIHLFVKDRVAPYKQLRGGIVVVEAIPRSASGKILRKDLRSLLDNEPKAKL